MLSYRLGTVNDFHWEFKPALSYSKPHTFSSFLGEEKERKMYLTSPTKTSTEHHILMHQNIKLRENSSLGLIESHFSLASIKR